MKKEFGITILLVLLCAVAAIAVPNFRSTANLHNLSRLVGIYGIFGIGTGIVIITSGIDLSVGSVFALQGVLLSIMLIDWHMNWLLAAFLSILIVVLIGCLTGFLVAFARLQPFIVTLCGFLFYRSMARFIAHDRSLGFIYPRAVMMKLRELHHDPQYDPFATLHFLTTGNIGREPYLIPMPFIVLLIVAAIMAVVLHKSVYGRYLYAVGKNEDAARYSGIKTKWVIGSAYVVGMLLAGLTGIILAFFTGSIVPSNQGVNFELYGIAAAVLGGCSLRGGEGSILGILVGTILIQILQNLVNLLGIDSSLNTAVLGAVILLGVLMDEALGYLSRRRKRIAVDAPKATVTPATPQ
jgi:ribose transport system permease protein